MESALKYTSFSNRNADIGDTSRFFCKLYSDQREGLDFDTIGILCLEAQKGNKESRDKVLLENLGLAIKMAYMYRSFDDMDDLVQQGVLGILVAVSKYNPDLGYTFSTYAWNWIRSYIARYINNCSSTVRFPVHMAEKFKVYESKVNKDNFFNNEYTRYERFLIAKKEHLVNTIEEFDTFEAIWLSHNITSLDVTIHHDEDDGCALMDLIPDDNNPTASVINYLVSTDFNKILKNKLNEKEYNIVTLRSAGATLESIGQQYGVSRERIRQIENKALNKIRAVIQKAYGGCTISDVYIPEIKEYAF